MKLTSILPAVVAVCTLSALGSAHAREKDKNSNSAGMNIRNNRSESSSRNERPSRNDKHDRNDHHDSGRHDRDNHHGHVIIRPSFGYGYGYGSGYGYGYPYRYSPYYYSRPSVGYSYYNRPVYRGYSAQGSYSDSLAVDVQRELRRRGYYRGPIDGDIGPGSRSAIRAYQYDRGLSATGRIDSSLLRALGVG